MTSFNSVSSKYNFTILESYKNKEVIFGINSLDSKIQLQVFYSKPFEFLIPCFKKSQYIQIHFESIPNPLFIKINHLSQAIGISSPLLKQSIYENPTIAQEILNSYLFISQSVNNRNPSEVINKIISIVNKSNNISFLKIFYQLLISTPINLNELMQNYTKLESFLKNDHLVPRMNQGLLAIILDDDTLLYQILDAQLREGDESKFNGLLKKVLENPQFRTDLRNLRPHVKPEFFDQLLLDKRFSTDEKLQNTLSIISEQINGKDIKIKTSKSSVYNFFIDEKRNIHINYTKLQEEVEQKDLKEIKEESIVLGPLSDVKATKKFSIFVLTFLEWINHKIQLIKISRMKKNRDLSRFSSSLEMKSTD
jgi:hypothetical protein